MQTQLDKLAAILRTPLSYNFEGKNAFRAVGMRALRALADSMDFEQMEVSFNPGGIAVSGDLSLRGMFSNGHGVALYISQGSFREKAGYCRAIRHMKDYTGGPNRWIDIADLKVEKLKAELIKASKDPVR